MSQQHPSSMSSSSTGPTGRDPGDDDRHRTRSLQLMVLGAILAILGPLGGFLAGSMVGPAKQLGDYDAMFISMFVGLLVGGVGAVVAGLAALRFVRRHGHLY